MSEAFVYCWTDYKTNMLYVGSHKGTPDDGYICSSKWMKEEYLKRPNEFSRQILAEGTYHDMRYFEATLLKSVNADKDPLFYNKHNGTGKFYLKAHTEASKQKIKENHTHSWTGRTHTDETKSKMSVSMTGKKHTSYYGRPMSEKQKTALISANQQRHIKALEKQL